MPKKQTTNESAAAEPEKASTLSFADLLNRRTLYDLTPEKEATIRANLQAYLSKRICAARIHELQNIAQFADIIENENGLYTPAEKFILKLVKAHYDDGLTPKFVRDAIDGEDGFRLDFLDAISAVERSARMYPNCMDREEA